jgi:uncharacterized protein (DUF2267 family)
MDYQQFVKKVQTDANLDKEQAMRAVEATLQTLGERITDDEAKDLAAQLPQELKTPLGEQTGIQKYNLQEFLRQVARREGCSEEEARRHAQVVFQTLCEAVSHGEMKDVMSQLPKEFQEVFACRLQTIH